MPRLPTHHRYHHFTATATATATTTSPPTSPPLDRHRHHRFTATGIATLSLTLGIGRWWWRYRLSLSSESILQHTTLCNSYTL